MDSAPVFQTQASLKELAERPKTTTPEILQKVKDMKELSPQVLSGCWVDREGTVLAVYFGRGDPKKPTKEGQSATNLGDEANVMVRCICHLLSWTYQHIPQKKPQEKEQKKPLSTLKSPRPLSEQYDGRTLQDLGGDLSSRNHHGTWVSVYIFSHCLIT